MYRSETQKSDGQMAGSRRGVSQGQCRHVARRQGRDDDDNVPNWIPDFIGIPSPTGFLSWAEKSMNRTKLLVLHIESHL